MHTDTNQTGNAAGTVPVPRRFLAIYQAAGVAFVVTAVSVFFYPAYAINMGAVAFFLTYLVSVVARLPRMTKPYLRAHADESDVPAYLLLVFAFGVLVTAAIALFILLNGSEHPEWRHMLLGILSVVLGWLCIHTMLAFHYAYEYYGTDKASPPGKDGHRPHVGGLEFPGSEMPDALSFLYFSFVIAMTAQVSDVTVTSNAMRRLVLLHGILSFFFNTVILAIAVNIVVSLAH